MKAWDTFGEDIMRIARVVMDVIKTLFEERLNRIKETIGLFVSVFQRDWEGAFEHAEGIVQSFFNSAEAIVNGIKYIGENIVTGLVESMRGWLETRLNAFFESSVLGSVMRVLGINSPSKVFADKVGKQIVAGFAEGIDSESHLAVVSWRPSRT